MVSVVFVNDEEASLEAEHLDSLEDDECSGDSECVSAEEAEDAEELQGQLEEIKSLTRRLDAIKVGLANTLQSSKERLAILQSLPELVVRRGYTRSSASRGRRDRSCRLSFLEQHEHISPSA